MSNDHEDGKIHLPEYKNQISSGQLMQIGVMLVAMAAAWTVIDTRSQASVAQIIDHEARLRSLERDVLGGLARIEQRIIQLERSMQ
jgi:hypothetical protein